MIRNYREGRGLPGVFAKKRLKVLTKPRVSSKISPTVSLQGGSSMDRKKTIRYLGAMYFLYIASNSFWTYSTNYFREIGFNSSQIGAINATGSFAAMLALPLIGVLSDKLGSPRRVFACMMGVVAPLHFLFPVVGGIWGNVFVPFLILCVVSTVCRQSGNSLLDSWIGAEMDQIGASFGTIRKYGSGAFVIGSIIASLLIGKVLPNWVCFLFVACMAVPIFLLAGSHKSDARKEKEKPAKITSVLKYVFGNYYFVTYLLMAMAFDAFLGIISLDMSYLMDEFGTDRANMGYVGAVRASTEVVVMLLIAKCRKLPPYPVMLVASGLLVALEHFLYPSLTGLGGMLFATFIGTGLAGGMFYGIGANYVFKIVDHRAASTAMAILGLTKSLVAMLGSGVGGRIIEKYGVLTLTTGVGCISLVLTLFFGLACLLGRFVLKIPYVSEKQTV